MNSTKANQGILPAAPIMAMIFAFFLVVGVALPVLPLHVHDVLGFGPFVVGLVTGFQFIASLGSRLWAGRLADQRGPKAAVVLGLGTAIAGGSLYVLSMAVLSRPTVSLVLLLIGRTLMGGAESLVITGGITWALGLVDPKQSARSIAWVGMAMFAALAVGAPLGSAAYSSWTFQGIAIATVVVSVVALLAAVRIAPFVPAPAPAQPIGMVMKAVALPGLGFALSGITFGAMTAFLTLYFSHEGWRHGSLAFTAFAVSLIVARTVAGHLPDKYGGARVAAWSLGAQAVGLGLVGASANGNMAIAGAVISGLGFSLVFPSLGLEAVRLSPPEARGLAMGVYNAYLDLTLGFVAPLLGLLASAAGLRSVFLASSVCAALAIPVAGLMLQRGGRQRTPVHCIGQTLGASADA